LPLPDTLAPGWFFLCRVGYAWYVDLRRVAGAVRVDTAPHNFCGHASVSRFVVSTDVETIDYGEKLAYDFTQSIAFNGC
jgi:hypothetical protein